MRRPLGVSLSAVFLAVVAVFGFFMTIVFVQVASRANIKSPPSTHVLAAAPIVACGATTIYAICVFAGLLRGRDWARLSGIVFGAVLIIFAIIAFIHHQHDIRHATARAHRHAKPRHTRRDAFVPSNGGDRRLADNLPEHRIGEACLRRKQIRRSRNRIETIPSTFTCNLRNVLSASYSLIARIQSYEPRIELFSCHPHRAAHLIPVH